MSYCVLFWRFLRVNSNRIVFMWPLVVFTKPYWALHFQAPCTGLCPRLLKRNIIKLRWIIQEETGIYLGTLFNLRVSYHMTLRRAVFCVVMVCSLLVFPMFRRFHGTKPWKMRQNLKMERDWKWSQHFNRNVGYIFQKIVHLFKIPGKRPSSYVPAVVVKERGKCICCYFWWVNTCNSIETAEYIMKSLGPHT
jgi:hypothetical protein